MSNMEQEASRVLILLYEEKSLWDSCNDITDGYKKLYESCFEHIEYFTCDSTPDSPAKLNEKIRKNSYNKIIFLDHRIRVPKELYYFVKDKETKKNQFIFHVYGCFINRTEEWRFIRDNLDFCDYNFVAGSLAHKRLVDEVLGTDVLYIPFVVLDSKLESEKQIPNLNIDSKDKVLLYAGRVSPGKNVIALCEIMNTYNESRDKKLHLVVAGSIDDMGGIIGGNDFFPRGTMAYNFAKAITGSKYIHYVPYIENKKLLMSYYKRVDGIISLSTMLYEDFGMSIADGLALGKKIICTNWGGYKEFTKYSDQVISIKVNFSNKNFNVSKEETKEALDKFWEDNHFEIKNPFSVENLRSTVLYEFKKNKNDKIVGKKYLKALKLFRFRDLIKFPMISKLYGSYYD